MTKTRSVNSPYGLLPSHTVIARTPIIMAGELNVQCLLQHQVPTVQPSGNILNVWTTIDTIWASIIPLHGTIMYAESQAAEETSNWIRIRWRPDVRANMRLVTEQEQYWLTREPLNVGYRFSVLLLFAKWRLVDER